VPHYEDNMICDVCRLVDGPTRTRPQTCFYCGRCNAWMCLRCSRSWFRRTLAAFLRRWKRVDWAVLPLLFVVLAMASPAHGQAQFCTAGLQAIPSMNVSDTLNKVYQGACWDATNHIITFPLTSGSGFITGTLTTGRIPLANGVTSLTDSSLTDNGTGSIGFATGKVGRIDITNTTATPSTSDFAFVVDPTGQGTIRLIASGAKASFTFATNGDLTIAGPTAGGNLINFTNSTLVATRISAGGPCAVGYTAQFQGPLRYEGNTSGEIGLQATAIAGSNCLTLPALTGTLDAQWTETATLESLPTTVTKFGWSDTVFRRLAANAAVLQNEPLTAFGTMFLGALDVDGNLSNPEVEFLADANNINILHISRFTDVAPTGTYLNFTQSNGSTLVYQVNTLGKVLQNDCAAVGTAANPSIVSCGAFPVGVFSCDVAASGGTCQVNDTQVTANSEILVTENSSEGTRLGVTCNTAPSVVPAITLASKSAGASFIINAPTFITNPACFDYVIIN